MDLDIIRQEIDQIDDQIVKLLEERMHLVESVVAYKKASGKAILDTKKGLEYLTGAEIRVDFAEGYPAVINDSKPYEIMREVVSNKEISYIELEEAYLYGEDFSFFSRLSPINYSFLGLRNEEKDFISGLHTPTFNFDEKILATGVKYYLELIEYYNKK